jgi:hypothetical protein
MPKSPLSIEELQEKTREAILAEFDHLYLATEHSAKEIEVNKNLSQRGKAVQKELKKKKFGCHQEHVEALMTALLGENVGAGPIKVDVYVGTVLTMKRGKRVFWCGPDESITDDKMIDDAGARRPVPREVQNFKLASKAAVKRFINSARPHVLALILDSLYE